MLFYNFASNSLIIFLTLCVLLMIFMLNLLILFWALKFHFIAVLIVLDLLILINVLLFVFYTYLTHNALGHVVAIVLIVVAACDTCVGLALFVTYYRLTGTTKFS